MNELLCYLQEGAENAKSRYELCVLTGKSDRMVRKSISLLQNEGYIICNTQNGNGYYLSDNTRDIAVQYNQNENRARAILRKQKYLRRKLKARGCTFENGRVAGGY